MADEKTKKPNRAKGHIGTIIVSVVLVLALLAVSLNFFGVYQKTLKAVKIDGKSYSMSELSTYYMLEYNYYYQMSSYYDQQYGEGAGKMMLGVDMSQKLDEQVSEQAAEGGLAGLLGGATAKEEGTSDDAEKTTWADHLMDLAIDQMAHTKRNYYAALDKGIELTDEDKSDIESTMSQYDQYLGNYSLSRYLQLTYGKGVTEKLYRQIVTEQKYSSRYEDAIKQEFMDKVDEKTVMAEYNKDTTAYDIADLRMFYIDPKTKADEDSEATATEEQVKAAEEKAQQIISDIKANGNTEDAFKKAILASLDKDSEQYETFNNDGASLLKKTDKSVIKSNVSEEAANWVYAKSEDGKYERKTADMVSFTNSSTSVVYILYIVKAPYADTTIPASVRHILRSTSAKNTAEDTSEDTTVDAAALKETASKEAESILNDYKAHVEENSGKSSEEYFAELADKYSDDTASTAKNTQQTDDSTTGGLISDLKDDGTVVPSFEDWIFSKGAYAGQKRAEGDTGIIESDFGYHVMYYIGGHKHPAWYESIQSSLSDNEYAAWEEEQEKSHKPEDIEKSKFLSSRVTNSCIKQINENNAQRASQ